MEEFKWLGSDINLLIFWRPTSCEHTCPANSSLCRTQMDPASLSKADVKSLADEARGLRLMPAEGQADLPEGVKQSLEAMQQQQRELFQRQLDKVRPLS